MERGSDHFLDQRDDGVRAFSERWQAVAPDRIDWRRWDDGKGDEEFVVFDGATAKTHLLTGDAGAVLMALVESGAPCGAAELLARVAGEEAGPEDLTALGVILEGLEHIGLAGRAAP